jgi:hypothetical protein
MEIRIIMVKYKHPLINQTFFFSMQRNSKIIYNNDSILNKMNAKAIMILKENVRMAVTERAPRSCPASDFGISSTDAFRSYNQRFIWFVWVHNQ